MTPTPSFSITLEPVDASSAAEILHPWLADPRARFWGMTDATHEDVRSYLDELDADPRQSGWLGRVDGHVAFYVETYEPSLLLPSELFTAQPGDIGMHLLVSPPRTDTVGGYTSAIMQKVVQFCLDENGLGRTRIVVEPDIRNTSILAKNAAAGFRFLGEIDLETDQGYKRAALSVCTRADFAASPLGQWESPTPHLRPDIAAEVHRHLVAKAISEFAHERLISPVLGADGAWQLDAGASCYSFRADVLSLEHWVIDEASLQRRQNDASGRLDVLELIVELQSALAIPDELLSVYLEELSSTFAGAAAKRSRARRGEQRSSTELLQADFQQVEAAMTEGHPGFLANNGRIGFSLTDYRRYAPENGQRVRLMWVAAAREHAHLALGDGLDEDRHHAAVLTADERRAFTTRLADAGHDPEAFHFLPMHPWQAEHRLPITFAPDIARGNLVPLGFTADEFQPQQSIRTFFNLTRNGAPYVKVALGIQNMGFVRGLSPAYMRDTPAINDWVAGLVSSDAVFASVGFRVLRERAALGYSGDVYHRTAHTNPHQKMLAALWRENPVPLLEPGERVITMASLVHRDHEGHSHIGALIRASGQTSAEWVKAYLRAYLYPLVHALLAYDLAFMPHGENLILRIRDHAVAGVFMKDIGEEVSVLGPQALSPEISRIKAEVSDREKALAIFTDVFDGVLRHIAGILDADSLLPADEFWRLVASCLDDYESDQPETARGLSGFLDLRTRTFAHSCLNRLQLRNTLQMVDLANQSESLLYAGEILNPVARS
ncbi:Siderophore synthetase component [Agreia bicolorata]|uniref:Lysine N-acyltransferase MbtK n=1 Tax=Agreia bicolorata TaxID=110935 RepID=A0A1T4YFK1_9MICO|nr:GNAT family N-acetyltransferase [Agreia bicolorata]SKB00470.1 Siderophore synthetase component [Agreia bicolorata]